MRFTRGELRARLARATDADELRFLVVAVLFLVTVLFCDEDEGKD
jgi:hypothetical protein